VQHREVANATPEVHLFAQGSNYQVITASALKEAKIKRYTGKSIDTSF